MIGVFGLMDPLRPGIAEAIDFCNVAGINVRMCTGDNIVTATAISKEAHILSDSDLEDKDNENIICMNGRDFS